MVSPLSDSDINILNDVMTIIKSNPSVLTSEEADQIYLLASIMIIKYLDQELERALTNSTDINYNKILDVTNSALAGISVK
jgi:hypothetical protein